MRHLWSMMRARLEKVDIGDGVEGIILIASSTARLRQSQTGIPGIDASPQESAGTWGELVDTLATRLGADNVVRLEPVQSHIPERAFRERSVMEGIPARSETSLAAPDRPMTLFSSPEPARAIALTPDGPLLSLNWRGLQSRIIACSTPERIAPEWWRADHARGLPPDRDYFAVQMESGRWLWAFRHVGTGRWFVHGQWS
jgi:protein ImuB